MDTKENINFIFKLDNKNRSGNFFFLFIASGVIASGIAIAFVAIGWYKAVILEVTLAAIYFFFLTRISPSFFEMIVTENELQVNFYSVSSTFRNYQSIEIPLNQLIDYRFEKQSFNLKETLILGVKSKYGIADYPPVSISILKKNEKAQIAHVLEEIVKNNRK